MKKITVTVLVTLIILFLGFVIYISSGSYDISQLTPHNGLTKWIIRKTTHNSIDKRMGDNVVPAQFNSTINIEAGFKIYDQECKGCHGAPGIKQADIAEGLYPRPPQIYKHKDHEDPQEFFWIIKNGIKMTSMPAYAPSMNDNKLWQVTAFVTEKLNTMTAEEYVAGSKK